MDDTPITPDHASPPGTSSTQAQSPPGTSPPSSPPPADPRPTRRSGRNAGIILILLGLFFYAQQFLPTLSWALLWPGILIVIGLFVLLKARRS